MGNTVGGADQALRRPRSAPIHRLTYVGALLVVLFGSFLLTLWLLEPGPDPRDFKATPPESDLLANRQVADYDELRRMAGAVGLKRSQHMKGNIDRLNRINDREVTMAGWLADPEHGDATPSKILVFVGNSVAVAETKGERPDVTHHLGLGFGSEKNVAFQINFTCRQGDRPVVVGLGIGRQYYPLQSGPCP